MAKPKMKGVTSISRKGTEYWYARINGERKYCGKGDKGYKIAVAAKAKEIAKQYENREINAGLKVKKVRFKKVKQMIKTISQKPIFLLEGFSGFFNFSRRRGSKKSTFLSFRYHPCSCDMPTMIAAKEISSLGRSSSSTFKKTFPHSKSLRSSSPWDILFLIAESNPGRRDVLITD